MIEIDNPHALELDVPRLNEYFGLWAMLEDPFRAAVTQAETVDLHVHVNGEQAAAARAAAADTAYEVTAGGVAVIPIAGTLMKRVDSFTGGTSTVRARQKIRAAANDDEVVGILLHIESPGGTVAGTSLLADEIYAAKAKKPVIAFIEDLGASAAYWIATAADRIVANRTAVVGSIGTYGVIYDQSARATLAGIKVHVIRAGAMKGAGTPGTEITAEQLADWQRTVDDHNRFFVGAVVGGRKMDWPQAEELADGRVWVGDEARKVGLIDMIGTLESTLAEFPEKQLRRSKAMSQEIDTGTPGADAIAAAQIMDRKREKAEPAAATFEELQEHLVGADAEFVVGQLKARATLDEARAAWMAEQSARIAAAEKRADDAAAAGDAGGVDPVGTRGEEAAAGGDAGETFWAAVAEKRKAGASKARAVAAVAREHPELREAMIEEHNLEHNKRRRR